MQLAAIRKSNLIKKTNFVDCVIDKGKLHTLEKNPPMVNKLRTPTTVNFLLQKEKKIKAYGSTMQIFFIYIGSDRIFL